MVKYRVREVAKDFNVASKVVTEILAKYGTAPKSTMQVLTEAELNIVFDYLTFHNQIESLDEVFAGARQKSPEPPAPPVQEEKSAPEEAAAPQEPKSQAAQEDQGAKGQQGAKPQNGPKPQGQQPPKAQQAQQGGARQPQPQQGQKQPQQARSPRVSSPSRTRTRIRAGRRNRNPARCPRSASSTPGAPP